MSNLPPGWAWTTLGEIAQTSLGKMLDRGKSGGHPLVRYLRNINVQWGHIRLDDVLTMEMAPSVGERFALRTGDLLVCEGGEIGRCAIWPGSADYVAFQKALHRVRLLADIDPRFLSYSLQHLCKRGILARYATGSTIKHLPQQQLRRLPIVLPPISEQRRIVDVLEAHLSHLDAAWLEASRARRRLSPLRWSALRSLRQSALDSGALLCQVGEIAVTSLGKMLDAKKVLGTSTPYLRNINVRWGAFDLNSIATVPLTAGERVRFRVDDGDVFVCEGGEPGRCAVWRGESGQLAYQKALHRLRATESVRADWLAVMLEEAVRSDRVAPLLTGTTIKHLPQEKLRLIELPVPPLHQQDAALAELDKVDSRTGRLRKELEATSTRSDALRRSLLAAAFSGQLAPQDPNDEPAELLLKRIQAERNAEAPRARRTRKAGATQ
jgi:type I restriction enzyme S subunit